MKKLIEADKKLFMIIYSYGEKHKNFGKIGVIGTKLSYYIFFVIFIIGIICTYFYNPTMLIKFILVPFSGLLINTFLRKAIGRNRPMNVLKIESRIGEKKTNSCPSNHSASAMVITTAFIWTFPIIGFCLIPIAFLTGFSRIISGVHFPLDVLCGLTIGALIGIVGFWII